jgi:hypothetical protein
MATIGKLAVQITADAAGLTTGLKKAEGEISSFSDKADALVGKLRAIGPAAILAGSAFAGALIKNVADTADELGKLSAKTGIAVEDLSRLQYAAGLSGVSSDQLGGAITKLSKNMADAATGTGDAAAAFDAMGVSVKNADGTLKSQRDVLEEVADRFSGYADGAEKSALAQRIFGRAGADLIPLLNSGAKGLKDMADESDRLGNTIDTKTAKAAERFNDDLTRLNTAIAGAGRQIAGPLIQSLADASNYFIKTANDVGIARAMLLSFGAALEAATGTDRFGTVQREVKSTGNAINLTALQLEKFSKMAESGIPGASQRVEELKNQMIVLLNKSAAASDKLKELANEAYKPIEGAPLQTGAAPQVAAPASAPTASTPTPASAMPKDALDEWFENNQKKQDQLAEREREYWASRVQRIEEGLMSESELLNHKHQADLERLDAAVMSEDERRLIRESLEMDHLDRMTDIEEQGRALRVKAEADAAAEIERIRLASMTKLEKFTAMSYQDQAMAVGKAMTDQLTSVTTNSRAMFNIQKAANISQAIMDTYAGANRALKDFPAPFSYAVAGATLAAGLSRVASIKSQTFGGASTAAASTGGAGVAATSGMAQQSGGGNGGAAMNQSITVQGIGADSLFSGDAVRTLIDRLIDAQRNGARIVLA